MLLWPWQSAQEYANSNYAHEPSRLSSLLFLVHEGEKRPGANVRHDTPELIVPRSDIDPFDKMLNSISTHWLPDWRSSHAACRSTWWPKFTSPRFIRTARADKKMCRTCLLMWFREHHRKLELE